MSGITIPTLDEITGHTVMAKLRSLCKRFIGLAEEVDEKIDAPLEEAHLAVETANATLATAQESLEDAQDAVTTANSASATANEASESAQESVETVAGYDTRLTAVENGKINITDINNYAIGLTGNQENISGNKKLNTIWNGTVRPKDYGSCGPATPSYGNYYLLATIPNLPNNVGLVFSIYGGLNNTNYLYARYRLYNGSSGGITLSVLDRVASSQYQKIQLYALKEENTVYIYATTLSYCSPRFYLEWWDTFGNSLANLNSYTINVETEYPLIELPDNVINETVLVRG